MLKAAVPPTIHLLTLPMGLDLGYAELDASVIARNFAVCADYENSMRGFCMRYIALAVILSGAILTAAIPGTAEQEEVSASDRFKAIEDLAYYEGADAVPESHALTLVMPTQSKPRATLLWIHGGAWAAGGHEKELGLAQALAQEGIAVAAMSYRLSPGRWMSESLPETGVQHPAHIQDVARAFKWLWDNAPKYGLNRKALFVGGFSAGGHLSALLATDERYLIDEGLSADAIRGAIPVAGTYDIEHYFEVIREGMSEQVAQDHVIGVFGPRSEHAAASPSSYLEQSSTAMLVISEGQTVQYADHFQALVSGSPMRDDVRFELFEDETHASLYSELIKANERSPARDLMISFMDMQMGQG